MTPPRILIAGIGNIFLGDDAFGSEVARRLVNRPMHDGVRVVDFGVRGFDLTFALLDEYEATIFVDAVQRGGPPGTLYVIEPDPGTQGGIVIEDGDQFVDTHGMDPVKAIRLATAMGGQPRRALLVGCEPATLGTDEDPVMGLSAPVQAAVGEAIPLIDSLVERLIAEQCDRSISRA
jgi:hydrogenase maturation protease